MVGDTGNDEVLEWNQDETAVADGGTAIVAVAENVTVVAADDEESIASNGRQQSSSESEETMHEAESDAMVIPGVEMREAESDAMVIPEVENHQSSGMKVNKSKKLKHGRHFGLNRFRSRMRILRSPDPESFTSKRSRLPKALKTDPVRQNPDLEKHNAKGVPRSVQIVGEVHLGHDKGGAD